MIDAENGVVLNAATVGLNHVTGVQTRTQAAGETLLDSVELALNDLRVGAAFTAADTIVINPADFSSVRRSKDLQGRYLLNPDPSGDEASSVWGVPVLQTTTQPQGTIIVANLGMACAGWVRQGLVVDSASTGTDWSSNITAIRAEERLGVAVVRPAALLRLTLL